MSQIVRASAGLVAAAALNARDDTKHWSWFGAVTRQAPYFSSILIIAVGFYVDYVGWSGLAARSVAG
jgi:nickel/cobalt exporter